MRTFVDPRTQPQPSPNRTPAAITEDAETAEEIRQLCRQGRLYDLERWIQAGRPLQPVVQPPRRGRRPPTPLEAALETGNHAVVLLLLCNGYDPKLEPCSPIDIALEARRLDLVDLLLEWGADPHDVDLEILFGTYDSTLFERFRSLGVDLTANHELARTLAHHTSNKPLFGYAKRHRARDPRIQAELNAALTHHAWKANEKGIQLCLWAGADPHAPAHDLSHARSSDDESDTDGARLGQSAIEAACWSGDPDILERLGPDPALDDYDKLYRHARGRSVAEILARDALPSNMGDLISYHLRWLGLTWYPEWRAVHTIRDLFEVGARWTEGTADEIANVRSRCIQVDDYHFVKLMKLLTANDHCAPDVLHELARTPAIRRRMKEVGFIPPGPDEPARYDRPTRSREVLAKCGIEIPKSPPFVPRVVHIGGGGHRGGREIRMDRQGLFERVWSEPIVSLAEEWGLSGPGLRKACNRLKVPVPPRGHWAKVKAGKRVRRPRLPELPEGEGEEVVVWVHN